MQDLVKAQGRTEQALADLAFAQERVFARLDYMAGRLSNMQGTVLELEFRNKATGYFNSFIRKARPVTLDSLYDVLDARLTEAELNDVLLVDLVIQGRLKQSPSDDVFLAVEVAEVLDAEDVRRASRRAALLRKAGYRAIPVAAGRHTTEDTPSIAQFESVALLYSGNSMYWDRALEAWRGES